MKKFYLLLACVLIGSLTISTVHAGPVELYLDTAPNASGSPSWPAFRDASYASIYDDNFVNQAHSSNAANIGTLNYEVADYLVYSFGDLGKRLHAFYYIPGETTTTLSSRFQVSIQYNYNGVWYNPYQEYGWGEWVTPSSWVNYDGDGDGITDGVMGSMGNALWGAYAYSSGTPEAYAALASDMADGENYLGNTRFFARLDNTTYELQALHSVPEPATILLIGLGLVGLAGTRRRLHE